MNTCARQSQWIQRALLAAAFLLAACNGSDYQVTAPPPPPPPPPPTGDPVASPVAVWTGTLRLDLVPKTTDCVLESFRKNPKLRATLEIEVWDQFDHGSASIRSEHFGIENQGANFVAPSSNLDLSVTGFEAIQRGLQRGDPLPIASGECDDGRRKYILTSIDFPPIENAGDQFTIRGRSELVVLSVTSRPMDPDTPLRFLDPHETSVSGKVDLVRRIL